MALNECDFVLFIAPNKERIYSEYMPAKYGEPAKVYAVLQLIEYLRKHTDIKVVYPYDELMSAKHSMDNCILYHKTDTHWNELGAYIGTSELLKELGIRIPDLCSKEISISETGDTPGDLANMLNLGSFAEPGIKYSVTGYDNYSVKKIEDNFFGVKKYKNEGADTRKIFVHRDSFGSGLMAEIIGSQFEESYLVHSRSYTGSEMLREQQPDVFVYETVERYIDGLLEFVYE